MSDAERPRAIVAAQAPPRARQSTYPAIFAARVAGRFKRPLGDLFGLTNFGVNLTRLASGSATALRHWHTRQDEFVYVLEGTPTLVTDGAETLLAPGMCAGFKAGAPNGHHIINRTSADVVLLEVGDRTAGDSATYPDDDLEAHLGPDGKWTYSRKDGTSY